MYRNLVRPLSQALGRLVKFTAGLMSPNNVIWQSGRNRTSGQPLQIRVLRIMFCTQVNRCLYSCTGRSQQRQRLFGILSSRISLELHVSAIPLIFVLHFKCSVLILDKKMNFTKLWRALWPLWHLSGVFTAHQACLPFCPNNWATIDHFVGTIAHIWSLHLPKLMIFKSHFNRSKEQRACQKRLGAFLQSFLLWCNLHPKQGEVFPVPEVYNLSLYLLYHLSFHHFSFCKITAFHNIWSHRESVWGAPSPVQECFSRLIRCQTSFLEIHFSITKFVLVTW